MIPLIIYILSIIGCYWMFIEQDPDFSNESFNEKTIPPYVWFMVFVPVLNTIFFIASFKFFKLK